jgi:putative lipoprotein
MALIGIGFPAAASLLLAATMAHSQGTLMINGTATYRERMALPPSAVFEATLEDVSRADAASRVLGLSRMENPGNPPFHFTISYDLGQIVQNHTYSVRARISEGGKLLFTTDQQYQVLTQGHGSEIGMMLLRRASSPNAPPAAGAPLRETYWKLIQLGDKTVTAGDQQREANLIFHTAENRVTGSGGCNRLTGTYMADSHALRFNGVASTQMACIHGMETEMAFLGVLDKVRTWKITNQQLELYDAGDKLLARFTAQAMK